MAELAVRSDGRHVFVQHPSDLTQFLREEFEAVASVVATDVGGASEQILHGETGLLVPTDDEHALAGAIERLAASPELRTDRKSVV